MDDPPDLKAWGLHCFCPSARATPHRLIRTGTNGKLLYEARNGTSLDGLDASTEQLRSLAASRLLELEDGRIRTAFPVLGSQVMSALRAEVRRVAAGVVDAIEPAVRGLRVALTEQALGASHFALMFGYALDLLLWESLTAGGDLPETGLTPDRPLWNGAFLAIYPPREGSSGTNFLDCGDGLTLVMVWSDETVQALDKMASTPGLCSELHDLADGKTTAAFAGLRLIDGQSAVPIVGSGTAVDDLARRIAEPVANLLTGDLADRARALVSTNNRAIATVVVAHELIWELTDLLIAQGTVTVPSTDSDVTRRLFLRWSA
jgi:hypothetical protein